MITEDAMYIGEGREILGKTYRVFSLVYDVTANIHGVLLRKADRIQQLLIELIFSMQIRYTV